MTKEILLLSSKLKVIGRAGIGVDNVDINYATSKGIIVMNTPPWKFYYDSRAHNRNDNVSYRQDTRCKYFNQKW